MFTCPYSNHAVSVRSWRDYCFAAVFLLAFLAACAAMSMTLRPLYQPQFMQTVWLL